MKKLLTNRFFDRPAVVVAKALLGKYLVRRMRGRKTRALMITEVEVYDGPHDRASHASRGRTPRNQVMFGEAGRFYVYFTYGMHWLMNIVTGPEGYPAAILLRAGVAVDKKSPHKIFINGPARLTKFLNITGTENGKPALRKTGVWFEDRGVKIRMKEIAVGPRIGVDYAGRIWARKLYNLRLNKVA